MTATTRSNGPAAPAEARRQMHAELDRLIAEEFPDPPTQPKQETPNEPM